MRRWILAAMFTASAAASAAGCAEGGSGNATTTLGTSSGGGGATGTGASTTGPGASTTGPGATTGVGGSAPDHAVINEISAKGADWIEIKNPGAGALDLGGHGLCDDVDPEAGAMCDLATIVRFPAGLMLPPGGYLLVVGNEPADAGAGPMVACLPDGGPATCFYATWKISASNGETVHLVDSSNAPVDEVHYPADAVPKGQTWGRLPDGTGSFGPNQPTPGAANAAP